jgi:hypothetical protein
MRSGSRFRWLTNESLLRCRRGEAVHIINQRILMIVALRQSNVNGGLNPRISGAALKIGTRFAVELLATRGRGDRALSTPQAAGGGGRRPAFTAVYRPARIVRRAGSMAASGTLL